MTHDQAVFAAGAAFMAITLPACYVFASYLARRLMVKPKKPNFIFLSGHQDAFTPETGDRRFWIVNAPSTQVSPKVILTDTEILDWLQREATIDFSWSDTLSIRFFRPDATGLEDSLREILVTAILHQAIEETNRLVDGANDEPQPTNPQPTTRKD